MRILFHINHPAQYHMFKYVIVTLKDKGHEVNIIARNKDVLTQLLDNDGVQYINTHKSSRESNLFSLLINHALQYLRIKRIVKTLQPELMIGTSFVLPYISRRLKIPYINIVEDDAQVIPIYAKLSMSKSNFILAPTVCQLGKWEKNKLGYNSYHELAFLHPNQFEPDLEIAKKYISTENKNFLIRFTAFNAHHDYGKKGIDIKTANQLINRLIPHGNIYISSEREIPSSFEKYRLTINPNDIHHVMAFCDLIIGDSQSMAMEAACLGVPSIRLNDYAGRISVLEELEKDYELTFGFAPKNKDHFLAKIDSLIGNENIKSIFQQRKVRMLSEKADTSKMLIWLIENFPESTNIMRENPEYLTKFGGITNSERKYKLRKGTTSKTIAITILYLVILIFFYLIPLSESLSLNRYHYFTFRGDHVIHLLVFTPLPFLFLPLFLQQTKRRIFKAFFLALSIAICFELSHLFVSYRAFTLEDLTANISGVMIGLILLVINRYWLSKR